MSSAALFHSSLSGLYALQGQLSIDLQEVRESRRLKQSFPLHRPKKHQSGRKKSAFPGHLELEIKWLDFLDGG